MVAAAGLGVSSCVRAPVHKHLIHILCRIRASGIIAQLAPGMAANMCALLVVFVAMGEAAESENTTKYPTY